MNRYKKSKSIHNKWIRKLLKGFEPLNTGGVLEYALKSKVNWHITTGCEAAGRTVAVGWHANNNIICNYKCKCNVVSIEHVVELMRHFTLSERTPPHPKTSNIKMKTPKQIGWGYDDHEFVILQSRLNIKKKNQCCVLYLLNLFILYCSKARETI